MTTEFSALLPVIIIAAIVLVAAIWLLLRANRKTTIIDEGIRARDVLDEGAERASRNQALIDAAPAVVKPHVACRTRAFIAALIVAPNML